jgi:NADPH-dependent 2,4-dienoyl-CoA reductase/sulfur reductase-like enzyme
MGERLVVIGGDAGGMAAASQAKRMRADLEVVAFERGSRTSFAACGIPFYIGGEVESHDDLVARSPEEHRSRGIDVRTRHDVTAIDCSARTVTATDLEGNAEVTVGFDHLVIATGARPMRPPIPGIDDRDFVFGVQNLDDADRLLSVADERGSSRVVVVGGGYIGLEMAEAFCHRGAEVVVVEVASSVMRTLDADMAELIVRTMIEHGIELRTDTVITGFEPGAVHTEDGSLEADLVVLGMGVTPNSELAAAAGIELGARNAIRVDDHQRTSVSGVWSAGDCAESFHRVTREPTHIALGTVANRQARVAGINIGGGDATFPGVLGSAVTKLCNTEIGRTGLTEAEAIDAGFAVEVGRIEAMTRSGYFPGAEPVTVKLVADRDTGRLLGGQIVGGAGAAKRIDTVATAIWNEMAVGELVDLDLSYAPPFSPVWDPVQVAARTMI